MPQIQLKRTSTSNAPSSLAPGEPAWIDGTKTLMIGRTGGGSIPIAGPGAGMPFVQASAFGAVGDLVYTQPAYNTAAKTSGSDATSAIQAALNKAGSLVSSNVNGDTEGMATCYIGPGDYYISSTLVVPPNVVLYCDGVLFNFLSSVTAPIVQGSRHSHCRKLTVHANNQGGVNWGDSTAGPVACASKLDEITVWYAGVDYNSSLTNAQQKCGLRLFGLDFRLGYIWIKGGNIGLHLSSAGDVIGGPLFLIGSSTGLLAEGAEQVEFASVRFDTNISKCAQIDSCNYFRMVSEAFINSDNYGTPMGGNIDIGKYSTANNNIQIEHTAQSTGGYVLSVQNAQDCRFKLTATNARTNTQTSGNNTATSHWTPIATGQYAGALLAHNVGTIHNQDGTSTASAAVVYGTGLTGFLEIDLQLGSAITPYLGTIYGLLDRGPYIYVPGATQALSASSTIASTAGVVPISATAAIASFTSTPLIAVGSAGQQLELVNVGAKNISLSDYTNSGTNLGLNITLSPQDTLLLAYLLQAGGSFAWQAIGGSAYVRAMMIASISSTTGVATEALAIGALVNFYRDINSNLFVRNANAALGYSVHGYASAAYAANAQATVFTGYGSLNPNCPLDNTNFNASQTDRWLSDNQPGSMVCFPPTASGHLVQRVGFLGRLGLIFAPCEPTSRM